MITRQTGYLTLRTDSAPEASRHLQEQGYALLPGVFSPDEVAELEADIDRVFDELPPDVRTIAREPGYYDPFRYEMLNRSAACQRAISHRGILDVVEPLLGEDCHVIANTAWRQSGPQQGEAEPSRFWHIDAGPHVPRPDGVAWDVRIPYPVFAVAAHIMVHDSPLECGPTGVIPGSHTSGQAPPVDRLEDDDLTWGGQGVVPVLAAAGDVALFVSDTWHRRLAPAAADTGRYFLQCHYGRRDLAQRLRTTGRANPLSEEAIARAGTHRERALIGLHNPGFYDA